MGRIVAYVGQKFRIEYAREKNGAYPAEELFSSLNSSDQVGLVALFQRLADHGEISNEQKFKSLGGGLFEFKSGAIRMLCAYCKKERRVVLLTNAFVKKQQKTPKEEIKRARRIFEEDQAWLEGSKLKLVRKAGH